MLLAQHQTWRPSRAVFSQALSLLATHWKAVAWLWIWQLGFLVAYAAIVLAMPDRTPLQQFLLGFVSVLALAYQLAMAASLIHLVHDQRPRPLSQVMKQSVFLKLPGLVVMSLVIAAGVFAGTVLFVIPGVALAVFWSVAIVAMVAEDIRVRPALRRSAELVRGWWWPMFGRFLFLFTLLTLQAVIGFVPVVGSIVSGLVSLVLVPATLFYMYLTYKELVDIKQFKHLQTAHMHPAGKFLLGCWAFAVFTLFLLTTLVLDLVAGALLINPNFSKTTGSDSVLDSTESLVAPILK